VNSLNKANAFCENSSYEPVKSECEEGQSITCGTDPNENLDQGN